MAKFMKSAFQNPLSFYGILLIEVLAYSSYGVFINLSRVNGIIMYKSSSLVLILEIIKFTISFMILWSEKNKLNYKQIKFRSVISFSLPALCYGINNNLAVYMQDHMDPSTFQVLCNLKIVSTAVLYRLIMNRKLKFVQWLSLTLLTLAGMLNSYIGMKDKPQSLNDVYLTPVGLSLTLVYCFLSGLAGVYTEYILKKEPMTLLSLQNCYLYKFGILFNFTFWYTQTAEDESLFQGFTLYTWLVLLTQAASGLIMSAVMKYSSNIVRLFVITSAIPVATIISIVLFNFQPGLEFYAVIILVVVSIVLYSLKL